MPFFDKSIEFLLFRQIAEHFFCVYMTIKQHIVSFFLWLIPLLFLSFLSSCTLYQEGVLSLEGKKLTQIPDSVFNITNLRSLRLYGNELDSISYRIGDLIHLEELYLGKNNLTFLPDEIGNLTNLKILSVQYNELEKLPSTIGNLQHLEQLILNQNRLTQLPNELGNLAQLTNLQLNENRLETLPNQLLQCKNLQFLRINRNRLTMLPDSLGFMTSLKELSVVSGGMMLRIPSTFCTNRTLEILEVDQQTILPSCLFVRQTNRLRIIRR